MTQELPAAPVACHFDPIRFHGEVASVSACTLVATYWRRSTTRTSPNRKPERRWLITIGTCELKSDERTEGSGNQRLRVPHALIPEASARIAALTRLWRTRCLGDGTRGAGKNNRLVLTPSSVILITIYCCGSLGILFMRREPASLKQS